MKPILKNIYFIKYIKNSMKLNYFIFTFLEYFKYKINNI